MLKKLLIFCSKGYFQFFSQNLQKGVNICNSVELFLRRGSSVSDLWLIA